MNEYGYLLWSKQYDHLTMVWHIKLWDPNTSRWVGTYVTDEMLYDAEDPEEVFEDVLEMLDAKWPHYWAKRRGLTQQDLDHYKCLRPEELALYN